MNVRPFKSAALGLVAWLCGTPALAQTMTNAELSQFALQFTDNGNLNSCTTKSRGGTQMSADSLYRLCEFTGKGGRDSNGTLSISDYGAEGVLVEWNLTRPSRGASHAFSDSLGALIKPYADTRRECKSSVIRDGMLGGVLWTGKLVVLLNNALLKDSTSRMTVVLTNKTEGLPLAIMCAAQDPGKQKNG